MPFYERGPYPWKDSPEHIDEVVEHARRFLKARTRHGRPSRTNPASTVALRLVRRAAPQRRVTLAATHTQPPPRRAHTSV